MLTQLEKISKKLFFDSFENDDKDIMLKGFRFLYKENDVVFFTIEADDYDTTLIRKKWRKIKRNILDFFQAKDLSYIKKIELDEVFLTKLIEVCKAKKVEIITQKQEG